MNTDEHRFKDWKSRAEPQSRGENKNNRERSTSITGFLRVSASPRAISSVSHPCSAVFICGFILLFSSLSFAGPLGEVAEWMIRQGSKFSDDIAGKSAGELAVELEELAARTSRQVARELVENGGPGALRIVRNLGDLAPDAARLIAAHGQSGKLLVQQGPHAAVRIFQQYGDDGVKLMLHQGTENTGKLLAAYGPELASCAEKLSGESLAKLRHWMPSVHSAESGWKSAFTQKLKQGGDDFVLWVGKRWKELTLTGGLTAAMIAAYKVGDGLAGAIPNPAADPLAYLVWWLPLIAIAALFAAAWLARHWFKMRFSRAS